MSTAPVWPVSPPRPGDDVPVWERRYRASRVSLPVPAEHRPEACVLVSDASGTFEVWAWDRAVGTLRQVTDRREGTHSAALPPDGRDIWWFDDSDGDEFGVWRRQPFEGGDDVAAVEGLEPSYPSGLGLGPDGLAVVGRSTDDGAAVHLCRPGQPPVVVYRSENDASVAGLSADGALLVVAHTERGDALHAALRSYRLTADGAEPLADLDDGPGKGLSSAGFPPVPGDGRLLVVHERTGPRRLLVWDPASGGTVDVDVDLPGDLDAEWTRDGTALLVVAEHRGRSRLFRVPLLPGLEGAAGPPEPVGPDEGSVTGVVERPDGGLELRWSSAAVPASVRDLGGRLVLAPPGAPCPGSVPVTDVDAEGPGGTVHALLARPDGAAAGSGSGSGPGSGAEEGPLPAVFLLHGGPMHHDADAFDAERAAWVDAGYAVVQVNYRGSTGYGAAWQDAIIGRPGLTELEDVAAVRDRLVADGVVDPARCVAAGGSWGGYLTLLALGTQPEAWACGVAAVPVAHYASAYEDEMEALRHLDRTLFGGSPETAPDTWRASDPYSHVDAVRAPVLVLAGANDPRCPLRQIEEYLAALDARGAEHEVYRFDAGHGSLVVDERVRQQRAALDFVARHVPAQHLPDQHLPDQG